MENRMENRIVLLHLNTANYTEDLVNSFTVLMYSMSNEGGEGEGNFCKTTSMEKIYYSMYHDSRPQITEKNIIALGRTCNEYLLFIIYI